MQLISEEYRGLNSKMHADKPHYGVSGQRWASTVHGLAQAMQTRDILDYGCGKSTLASHLPFAIKQYDPAIEKYASMPEPADLVVCTDVLEHIEPELIGEVLDHLRTLTRRAAFLVIATRPAQKTLPDGRNAHLIVEDWKWWLAALIERFDVMNLQNMGDEFMVTVTPYKYVKNGASHA